jgi:hypothetical protein
MGTARAAALAAVMVVGSLGGPAAAQPAGPGVAQVKVVRGAVHVERAGQRLPATVGTRLQETDLVVTGPDGSAGIAFADDSLLSVGPSSALALDRFAFDPTTHQGRHETSLRHGTLAGISGKIARQTPEAMTVRTPAAILGVRGTEFAIRADR